MSQQISQIASEIFLIGVILVIVDMVYLYFSKSMYENQVVTIQRVAMQVKPLGAAICYIFIALGVWYFVLRPEAGNRSEIYVRAVIFGAVVFGVYNATSYAILKKYRSTLAAIDTVWGAALILISTTIYKQLEL
jgi:uncharacterized membrane protein